MSARLHSFLLNAPTHVYASRNDPCVVRVELMDGRLREICMCVYPALTADSQPNPWTMVEWRWEMASALLQAAVVQVGAC